MPKVNENTGVLFLENFPIENAGYQYRAAKWAVQLTENGIFSEVWTNCGDKASFEKILGGKGRVLFLQLAMWKRFSQCIKARHFHTVVVRRELLLFNDYGNLFMERFLLAIHPNVILDFDDDIGAAKREPRKITSTYGLLMQEHGSKFYTSLSLYKRFIVGNRYLKNLVIHHNPTVLAKNILVMPTCVDYDQYTPKDYRNMGKTIVLGWIGTSGNLPYLEKIIPQLNTLSRDFAISLKIISGKPLAAEADFPVAFSPWSLKNEVEDIKSLDIGLMPLHRNAVSEGKCGFKLIQYMALGLVSVAEDVAANAEIIGEDGKSGFGVPVNQWETVLRQVLSKKNQYATIGQAARERGVANYTFSGNLSAYIRFITDGNKNK